MKASGSRLCLVLLLALLLSVVTTARAEGPSGLASFPRPANDNGWGVHWAPTQFGQTREVVDYFVAESKSMGIKWVKFLNGDEGKLDHLYLVRTLIANDMMPVMRVYKPWNDPYEHLDELVRMAVPEGLVYIELYNEPNILGSAGGWRPGEPISVKRILDLWIPAAKTVINAGGFPGLPSLAPGGDYDDNRFLQEFLDGIRARGMEELLRHSWLPLHNYFLNHPVDYPNDDVNLHSTPLSPSEIARHQLNAGQVAAINQARKISRLPRAQGGFYVSDSIYTDSNSFRKFEAYEHFFMQRFGYAIPVISTEGGAVAGAQEDPRYPAVSDADVAQETLYAYRYMLEKAPPYYFAVIPWLLAVEAGGHRDPRFEAHAWYKDRQGTVLPVVTALKGNSYKGRTRSFTPENTPAVDEPPAQTTAQASSTSTAPATLTNLAPRAAPTPRGTPAPLGQEPYIVHANEQMTLRWTRTSDGIDVQIDSRVDAQGKIVFWQDGKPAESDALALTSGEVITQSSAVTGTVGVQIFGADDRLLLDYGATGPVALAKSKPVTVTGKPGQSYIQEWDKRIDELGFGIKPEIAPNPPKGQSVWRVTKVEYMDEDEAKGLHHIYVETLDEQGNRVLGQTVWVSWPTGATPIVTNKPAPEYGANFPMYGPMGSYSVRVDGNSDKVDNFGMLADGHLHISFRVVFQRVTTK